MQRKILVAAGAFLLVLVLAYANFFFTGLHSIEYATLRDNPAIRSLANILHFFVDPSTASVEPAEYRFQPLVTASYAIDYFVGRGVSALFLHLASFLVLLIG